MAKKQIVGVVGTVVSVTYPTIGKSLSVDYAELTESVQRYAGLHGLKQRLGDAESGGGPAEKYEMASRIVESMKEGNWELTSRVFDPSLVVEAVARVKEMDVEEIREALEAAGEDAPAKLKEWRNHSKVKVEMLKIQAERAEAKVTDDDSADDIKLD